jgi:hypothetical protein
MWHLDNEIRSTIKAYPKMSRSSRVVHREKSRNLIRMSIKHGFFFASVGSLVVLFLISAIVPLPSLAQSPLRWSLPQRIRGIADDTNPPYLVADQNRTVHAFYSQWTGNDLAVFYNQWTQTGGWTTPTDVLLSPDKQQATVLGAFLDYKGIFHVIFYGGIAEGAEIYYSSAPAANAGQALAWSTPRMIGDGATAPASGVLAGDGKSNLFVLYGGNRDGYGVYEVHSADGGATWSDPASLFLTDSNVQSTCCLRLHLGEKGWLHAIWLVVDKKGQGRGIYYARLNLRDGQWRFPLSLAQTPSGLGVRDPTIIEHDGIIFAAFYDADLGGHYVMRISSDDGQTWKDPITPFPKHIGANGAGSFVVDANGDLHLFWGERIPGSQGSPDIHGMWHSLWQGDAPWSEPEAVVSGQASSEFDPSAPNAVVSQGNVILVTWREDPGLAGNGVWYSYSSLNAPELPLLALPTPAASSTAGPSVTATSEHSVPTRTTIPRPAFTPQADSALPTSFDSNPDIGILIAILPVVLILSALVLVRNLRGPA